MSKLINNYGFNKTLENAQKIIKYDAKHMMACMFLTEEQSELYREAIAQVQNAHK